MNSTPLASLDGQPQITDLPPRASRWRVEVLVRACGFQQTTSTAFESAETALHKEGFAVHPPLRKADPQSDVWVYPFPSDSDSDSSEITRPDGSEGLSKQQRRAFLIVCGVLALIVSVVLLNGTGTLPRILSGGSGLEAASERRLATSFQKEYATMLRGHNGPTMRVNRVRCRASLATAYRCEALTEVSGAFEYPASFAVSVHRSDCWQARPVLPNIVRETFQGCA